MAKIILPTLIFRQISDPYKEIKRIKNYGADGVEIRRERLSYEHLLDLLNELEKEISAEGLDTVIYSVPSNLYMDGGEINNQWQKFAAEATAIKADAMKMSLGEFSIDYSKEMLKGALKMLPCNLLIENSQQIMNGRMIDNFLKFFHWAEDLPITMTFDVGNWAAINEDAHSAYELLKKHVTYIHLKEIYKGKNNIVSIPMKYKNSWIEIARSHKMAAIEFPLEDADKEAPIWIKLLKGENI